MRSVAAGHLTACVRRAALLAIVAALIPSAAHAGPPFLTDDPEPTETGHWEIYAPLLEASGHGSDYDGSIGAEINYGAAPNVQLTIGLPISYSHGASGLQTGRGDLELSVKYRFYHNDAVGLSIAAFPGVTLPTSSHGLGSSKVTALIPIWAQKDLGGWSLFGGGGYAINPGRGNRNFWTAGVAVTNQVTRSLLVGLEADREGGDAVGAPASTSVGVGAILQLKPPFRLLASGGPTFFDGGAAAGFHGFVALGLDF